MSRSTDPERDGWRAGRFGTNAPAAERLVPHDGVDRLAYWQAKREGERVRAVLAGDRVEEERARAFLLGSA